MTSAEADKRVNQTGGGSAAGSPGQTVREPGDPSFYASSKSVEWYTPARYIDAARAVLGGIDLDPASCETANLTVKATQFYSEAHDGLSLSWWGRVWLNPPYGQHPAGGSHQAHWTRRLLRAYALGEIEAGVALVNAETGAAWFQPLWSAWVCLTDHRIRFVSPAGEGAQPTKSNAFVYVGPAGERFAQVFSRFGRCIAPLPVRGQGVLL